MEVLIVKGSPGNPIYAMRGMQENWVSLTLGYTLIMTSVTYCEYNFCTFLLSPLYLLATYFISIESQKKTSIVRSLLNEEIQYLVPESMVKTNISRAIIIVATLLSYKYLQRLDVCYLIIKNWKIQKQQGQLQSYFMNQKDGVIIFEKKKKNKNDEIKSEQCAAL